MLRKVQLSLSMLEHDLINGCRYKYEIESDLRSLLPTADKALRPQLIEALSLVEKANQALQKSVERLT